jgi:hypothetical protein
MAEREAAASRSPLVRHPDATLSVPSRNRPSDTQLHGRVRGPLHLFREREPLRAIHRRKNAWSATSA